MTYGLLFGVWLFALIAAGFHVRAIRNPQLKPTEAYLIFVTAFSVAALIAFGLTVWALDASGLAAGGERIAALGAGLTALGAGWAVARWFVRQPPSAAPELD